jgi:hypothetical protein
VVAFSYIKKDSSSSMNSLLGISSLISQFDGCCGVEARSQADIERRLRCLSGIGGVWRKLHTSFSESQIAEFRRHASIRFNAKRLRFPSSWSIEMKLAYVAWRTRPGKTSFSLRHSSPEVYGRRLVLSRERSRRMRAKPCVMWKDLRRSADSRGIAVSMNRDMACSLFSMPCHYCGRMPRPGEELNGIDRFDNNKGYTADVGQCVPCCGLCNRMKSDHAVGLFLTHVGKIQRHQVATAAVGAGGIYGTDFVFNCTTEEYDDKDGLGFHFNHDA